MASRIGLRLRPKSVSVYSTRGGTSAGQKAAVLHLPELGGQHLLADVSNGLLQFAKALRTGYQIPQDQHLPLSLMRVSVVSTGQAKLTKAYNLPAKYVLHTVGPIISGRVAKRDRKLLASCYRSCLKLAAENGLQSVAFCCISTGEFHFPHELAADIAVETVRDFLQRETSVQKVIFNVFKDLDKELYEKRLHTR